MESEGTHKVNGAPMQHHMGALEEKGIPAK
jgi:hypothetical protein